MFESRFKSLIKKNVKSLPVTDESMTRFWITLDHGVEFVLNSLDIMIGGELFIPKTPSIKITDLVKALDKKAPSTIVVMGIDQVGEPHFWDINSGKNGLNSFTPTFSYIGDEGIYVVSQNRDKIFKPFYQHHLLRLDGTTETLPFSSIEICTASAGIVIAGSSGKPSAVTT